MSAAGQRREASLEPLLSESQKRQKHPSDGEPSEVLVPEAISPVAPDINIQTAPDGAPGLNTQTTQGDTTQDTSQEDTAQDGTTQEGVPGTNVKSSPEDSDQDKPEEDAQDGPRSIRMEALRKQREALHAALRRSANAVSGTSYSKDSLIVETREDIPQNI